MRSISSYGGSSLTQGYIRVSENPSFCKMHDRAKIRCYIKVVLLPNSLWYYNDLMTMIFGGIFWSFSFHLVVTCSSCWAWKASSTLYYSLAFEGLFCCFLNVSLHIFLLHTCVQVNNSHTIPHSLCVVKTQGIIIVAVAKRFIWKENVICSPVTACFGLLPFSQAKSQ